MPDNMLHLGLGIGWRPELALAIERRTDLGFVELIAESFNPKQSVPAPIANLLARGVRAVPHGITLSLGGAEPVDIARVDHLAGLAKQLNAPFVSEHIAFVRAGGVEAGHLLPIPRTRDALNVLVDNVRRAQDRLPVPLALENISALFDWPDAQFSEAEFVSEILDRTGCLMLLDIANVWANARNLGSGDRGGGTTFLDSIPLDRLAYVHVAGGVERAGVYHDTHTAEVPQGVLDLLEELCARTTPPGVMLERDDDFPDEAALNRELDAIAAAIARGGVRRHASNPEAPVPRDDANAGDPDDARQRLAAQQAGLVAALNRTADVPPGFDANRVHLAGRTLESKRRKGVAKSWPMLAAAMGNRFANTFAAFAAGHSPHPDGPGADGFAFASWLDARNELPVGTVPELLAAKLWRGPPIAFRVRRGVLAVRLPLLGVRMLKMNAKTPRPPR